MILFFSPWASPLTFGRDSWKFFFRLWINLFLTCSSYKSLSFVVFLFIQFVNLHYTSDEWHCLPLIAFEIDITFFFSAEIKRQFKRARSNWENWHVLLFCAAHSSTGRFANLIRKRQKPPKCFSFRVIFCVTSRNFLALNNKMRKLLAWN